MRGHGKADWAIVTAALGCTHSQYPLFLDCSQIDISHGTMGIFSKWVKGAESEIS